MREENGSAGAYGPEQCVHRRFEELAAQAPDAAAVFAEGAVLTYGELNRRANQLAHHLIGLGSGAEQIAGVLLDKTPEILIAVLAVLKTGAAYLPLDAADPAERLNFMLRDTGVRILLTPSGQLPVIRYRSSAHAPTSSAFSLQSSAFSVVCLDMENKTIARQRADNPKVAVQGANLAYVIYTSGSTGLPKAVMVPHGGLRNVQKIYRELYNLGANDRHLQMARFSFDVFSGDWVRALGAGGCLILVPRETAADAQALPALIAREKPTCAEFVPAVLKQLLQQPDGAGEILNCFRYLMVGSDVFYSADCRRTREVLGPQTRLLNVYGATETTIEATWFEYCGAERPFGAITPIGRPMPGYRVYLLDNRLHPVPTDATGELFIGGPGVCRGYLNRPDLTAEKFRPDPFDPEPGGRMYATGDLGRCAAEGVIEFAGRSDLQVKVRGFRIETGEIEAVLRQHPAIKEAVVVAHENEPGVKRLTAYWVGHPGQAPAGEDLRLFLKEHMPEYMIPSFFMTLEALPLTPNGKVDRRALPAPGRLRPDLEKPFAAPRTALEETLATLWAELLGVEPVGIHDDFFALGGHSLLAAQVLARVRAIFQIEVSAGLFFEQLTTVGKLAQYIEKGCSKEDGLGLPPLVRAPRAGLLPLSFPQEAIWFLHQLAPHSLAYHVQVAIRFKGRLDFAALQQTLNELVRRHEILRTSFPEKDGGPLQVIHAPVRLNIPVPDLRLLAAPLREAEAERLAAALCTQAFDITRIPLVRWTLLQLDAQDHLLVICEHHFVHDGWSMALLLREMKALYGAFSAGRPSPLAPPLLQFADFAVWQRQLIRGGLLEKQSAYWRSKLAHLTPLELPSDRPRPKFPGFRGRLHAVELGPAHYRALKQFSSAEGVTLFISMLTAFKVLLSRYAQQADIALGSSIANRRLRETEGLLGMILNTIVLRTDLSGNPTVREALQRVRRTALEAYAHQDLPFEKLVALLQPQREPGRNPLFQVSFAFHDAPMPDLEFSGLTGKVRYIHNRSAKFDLLLLVIPRGEQRVGQRPKEEEQGMILEWEYATDLFEPATIERMAGHYRNVLEQMRENPERRIADLALMDGAERRRVLVEWNDTRKEYPRGKGVHEFFEVQAERRPDVAAVVCENRFLAYNELNMRANQLAHYLRSQGVGPESLAAICLERSLDMIIGIMAVLKAGGAYVPLDPSYPPERLAFMLEDSGASILLTHLSLSSFFAPHSAVLAVVFPDKDGVTIHGMDGVTIHGMDGASITKQSSDNPKVAVQGENPAYVIYTSGSTGKPKGVMVQHDNLIAMLHAFEEAAAAGERLSGTALCPLGFDVAVWEFFSILCFGGTLHLVPQTILMEPGLFAEYLGKARITSAYIPPALLSEVIGPLEGLKNEMNLDRLLVGVEPIAQSQLERFKKLSGSLRIVNGYGPTETTVCATFFNFVSTADPERRVPIGRPAANNRVYLLDPRLQVAPIGIAGEACIGGAGVARGYWNRPDLTAEKYIPDPFFPEPGSRLYKTGDLARWRADGNIEFLGRLDHQVKIRGFRIELGEIETVLRRHPAVQEAAVTAWEDDSKNKRLAAYLVFKPGQKAVVQDLRSYLKNKLPEYMLPAALVALDKLPLTPSGKPDRKALPKPGKRGPDPEKGCAAPRTPLEKELVGIWQKILGIDRIGIHDHFFEIGGHSLLAARVAAHARAAFQVALPVRSLFESPTVAELAEGIERLRRSGAVSSLPPLIPETRPAEIPLSFSQQQMWEQNRLEPENPHYAIPTATSLTGGLNIPALRQALNEIIRRHESLRTRIDTVNGKAIQKIDVFLDIGLPVIDLQFLPPGAREAQLECLAKTEERKPFDTAREPLVRASLVRLAPEQHVLLLTIHHIVADGWSMGVLIKELNVLYPAFCRGRPAPLAPLAVQYADFAVWQRKWLQGEILEKELAFWKQKTAGDLHAPQPRFDRPRPEKPTFRGSVRIYRTSAALTAGLRRLGQEEGCTLFMALLAVFKAFLYACTGREDLFVATPVTNRRLPELEKLIGHFVHTMVLRTNLSGNPGFRDLLQRVKETALTAYPHQDLPFARWVAEPAAAALRRCPVFNLLNFAEPELVLPGLEISELFIPEIEATHDLELWVKERGPSIRFDLIGNTDVFMEQTLDRLMERFVKILNTVAENPDRTLRELAGEKTVWS